MTTSVSKLTTSVDGLKENLMAVKADLQKYVGDVKADLQKSMKDSEERTQKNVADLKADLQKIMTAIFAEGTTKQKKAKENE